MNILGIETSCDDTAAAIVESGTQVLASVLASDVSPHRRFGGVVPEIASRAHLEFVNPVITQALSDAKLETKPDAVAVTIGPGQIGALLVGLSTAKSYAFSWNVPMIGVNHLEGHLYAAFLEHADIEFPIVVLLVSGGHTMLIEMRNRGQYRVLGQTIDDAAGEAYDKTARLLGLGYPGGPKIDERAARGDASKIKLPRALRERPYDFSFSGIKTAVMYALKRQPELATEDVCASFQEAVVEVLIDKTIAAALQVQAKGIAIGGGVAANSALRTGLVVRGSQIGLPVFLPSRAMCTDNAAMIAAAGFYRLHADGPTSLDCSANPRLRLPQMRVV